MKKPKPKTEPKPKQGPPNSDGGPPLLQPPIDVTPEWWHLEYYDDENSVDVLQGDD